MGQYETNEEARLFEMLDKHHLKIQWDYLTSGITPIIIYVYEQGAPKTEPLKGFYMTPDEARYKNKYVWAYDIIQKWLNGQL